MYVSMETDLSMEINAFWCFGTERTFYCFINCNNAKLNATVSGGIEQRRQTPRKTDEALAKPPSEHFFPLIDLNHFISGIWTMVTNNLNAFRMSMSTHTAVKWLNYAYKNK